MLQRCFLTRPFGSAQTLRPHSPADHIPHHRWAGWIDHATARQPDAGIQHIKEEEFAQGLIGQGRFSRGMDGSGGHVDIEHRAHAGKLHGHFMAPAQGVEPFTQRITTQRVEGNRAAGPGVYTSVNPPAGAHG